MGEAKRIKELIKILNNASYEYYNNTPIMSDYEWDELYEKLRELESETGIIFNNSPTQNVGYIVADELKEVEHNHPMLSLDKTKSIDELRKFAGSYDCFLSVKCDGLTTSLRYIDGKLVSAETRGDGIKGVDVLQNVLTISNIPKEIPYKDELIIDGETIIGWDSFRKINESLPEDQRYKHPRNLVSGSLQLLDSKDAFQRNMRFIAWRVIKGFRHKSVFGDLRMAENNGFEIVPMWTYTNNSSDKENLPKMLESLRDEADKLNIPYDGAVMAVDGYRVAESMGNTTHHFNHSIAYKYEDELYETVLTNIEWSTSKTGLINPIAIFEPVDLGGAITTRATLHNLTYIKDMMLGIGDRIRVYRSNMVIPKVHDSIDKSGRFNIPDTCPICGGVTEIVKENDSEVLCCTNPDCKEKLLKKLTHAVSRNALNIDGLSEATIEKFIKYGWISSIKDIYHLKDYEKQMKMIDGFGEKSVEKLLTSIEASRKTTFDRFLYSLSIPLIGRNASKDISKYCHDSIDEFTFIMNNTSFEFLMIDGIGMVATISLDNWWQNNYILFHELSKEFSFEKPVSSAITDGLKDLSGLTFCITGSLERFENRDAAKTEIELHGGKVSSSVSAKTSYLVNNDIESNSSKNKKAKELGIPIISEEELLSLLQ